EVEAGNTGARAKAGREDELGALSRAFNAMADALDGNGRELRENERKYREVFDNVSDWLSLYEVTAGGRFRLIDANPAAEKLCGVDRREALGKCTEEFAPAEIGAH